MLTLGATLLQCPHIYIPTRTRTVLSLYDDMALDEFFALSEWDFKKVKGCGPQTLEFIRGIKAALLHFVKEAYPDGFKDCCPHCGGKLK